MTTTPRENFVRAEAARRGLLIEPFGLAWRIYGAGVDILVSRLADLDPAHDFNTVRTARLNSAYRRFAPSA